MSSYDHPADATILGDGKHNRLDALLIATVVLFTGLLTFQSFAFSFRGDELYHIRRADDQLRQDGILTMFRSTQQDDEQAEYGWEAHGIRSDVYRPLVDISFAIDRALWGYWYPGYRFTNFAIYATATAVVYWLARHLFHIRLVAVLAALLFITNYGHVHHLVGMVSNRTDSLVGTLVLLSFALFVALRSGGSPMFLVGSLLSAASALVTKETAVGLPLILLAYDLVVRRVRDWRTLRVHTVFFGLLTAYLSVRMLLLGNLGQPPQSDPVSLLSLTKHMGLLAHTLVPIPFLRSYPSFTAVVLAALCWLSWPLVRQPARLRFVLFTVLACYFAAGPGLLLGPPTRLLFASSGFLIVCLAGLLVGDAQAESNARRWVRPILATLFIGCLVGIGTMTFVAFLRDATLASHLVSEAKSAFAQRLSRMTPGDKVFFLSTPSGCASQGLFYNGLSSWIALAFSRQIRVYSLAETYYSRCEVRPPLTVVQHTDNTFSLSLPGIAGVELILGQVDMSRLPLGESLKNRYVKITVLAASSVTEDAVRLIPRPRRIVTGLRVDIDRLVLDAPGKNYFMWHDGHAAWELTEMGWIRMGIDPLLVVRYRP